MKKDYSNKDLSNVDLVVADLTDADLRGVNLTDADLRGVNLTDADLRGVNLTDADLRGADLTNANLSGADLRYTNLRYSILDNTNVEGITMDWHSHDLISYRLNLVAETNRQKFIAKHIINNRNLCWGSQIQKLIKLGYATEVEWALGVMVGWIKSNDKLPEVLKTRL